MQCVSKELYNNIRNATVWRVLRKCLHVKAYNLSIVQRICVYIYVYALKIVKLFLNTLHIVTIDEFIIHYIRY
jgi:hypothetical protein